MKKLLISLLLLTATACNPIQKSRDNARLLAAYSIPFRALQFGNRIYGSGSYIKYKNKFYILTNRHICLGAQKYNNSKTHIQVDSHIAKIIKIGKDGDLCVLESNKNIGLRVSPTAAQPLDRVTLIGFPRGIGKVIRTGRIVGDVTIAMNNYMGFVKTPATQISAIAYPGNSGSPVLNEKGLIIGVLFAGSPVYPTEPFIVPHKKLIEFLDSIGKKPISTKKIKNDNKLINKKKLKNIRRGRIVIPFTK